MKATSLIVLFIIVLSSAFAQTYVIPFEKKAKGGWGYMSVDGKILVEPQYKEAHNVSQDGVGLVFHFKSKRWLFIDQANSEIQMPFKSFNPKSIFGVKQLGFVEGVVVINVDGKFGCIGSKGEVLYKPVYDEISRFRNGKATGIIGKSYYFLNIDGTATKIQTDVTHLDQIKEGLAPFRALDNNFGFVNSNGEVVIKAQYKKVGYFYNGIAWARTDDDKIGFINQKGEWIFKPEYDAVADFDNDLEIARVRIGENWMFLRKSGETFTINNASKIGVFSAGLAWAKVDEKLGYVNSKGEWIIKPEFDTAKDFINGFAQVKKGEFWGLINAKGEYVLEAKYEKFAGTNNGMTPVKEGDLWGFVNDQGALVIEPKFHAIRDFNFGYAAARIGNSWGVIDKTGAWVVPAEYNQLKDVTLCTF